MKKMELMKIKKSISESKLVRFFLFGAVIVMYLFMMIANTSRVPINSDFSNLVFEAWDYIHGDIFLRDRQFTGVTFLTTDFPYFVIGTMLFGLTPYSYVLAVALMCLTIAVAGAILLKIEGKKYPVFLFCIFIAFSLLPDKQGIFYLRSHAGAAVLSFFALYFLNGYFKRNNLKDAVVAGILLVLALMGDMSSAVVFVAPMLVIYGYKLCHTYINGNDSKNCIQLLKVIFLSIAVVVCSVMLDKLFFFISGSSKNSFFHDQYFVPAGEYGKHIELYWTSLFAMFGGDFFGKPLFWGRTFFYFFRCLYLVIGLLFILKSSIECFVKEKFDFISSVLSLGFIFISIIFTFTSISKDSSSARYFSFAPVLFGIVIIRQFQTFDFSKGNTDFFKFCKIICISISFVFVLNYIRKVEYKFFIDKQLRTERCYDGKSMRLIQFLKDNNLSYGYSDFWHSSVISLFSKNDVRVRAVFSLDVNNRITRHNWFCKNSWYDEPANFIISTEFADMFGLTESRIIQNYGEPEKILSFEDYKIFVYEQPITVLKNLEDR